MRKLIAIALLLAVWVSLAAQRNAVSVLDGLADRYNVHFVYDSSLKPKLESLNVSDLPDSGLADSLDRVFNGTGIAWQRRGSNIILKTTPVPMLAHGRRVTVSGHITDAASSETLIGAGVILRKVAGEARGAVTNEFGFYTLTVPVGEYQLSSAHLGYDMVEEQVTLKRDTTVNIALSSNAELNAARIVSRKDAGIQSALPGALEVPVAHIKNMPNLLGEADVVKSLQMLPGVQGGVEGLSGLHVRGGGPEENLVLLDGVPLYNMDHLLGLFSIFQPEAVKDVTLFKGTFPARYGGRISSVLDIRTLDGNLKETHGSFTIGVLNDKFHLEGPIVKDKLSYSLSARGLHSVLAEPLLRAFLKETYVNYYYYDVYGKLCWNASDTDRLFFGVYHGRDNGAYRNYEKRTDRNLTTAELTEDTDVETNLKLNWGSTVASARWNHIWNGQLFSNAIVSWNRYDMHAGLGSVTSGIHNGKEFGNSWSLDYKSGIGDLGAVMDFDWTPIPEHLVKYGVGYTFHSFRPERFVAEIKGLDYDEKLSPDPGRNAFPGHEASVYAEDNFSLGSFLALNPGVRLTMFNTDGKNYWSLQPRFAAKADIPGGFAVKAGYSRMAQYVHLLSSSTMSLPIDLWVPITKDIAPVTSDQFSLGAYYSGLRGWEFSVEAYYKMMRNLLEYKEGVMFLSSTEGWEKQVVMGNGTAKGLEFLIRKTNGKTTGWLAYTLARSEREFREINLGRPFPYKYDRRHTVDLVLNHKFSDRFDVSASWMFASGGWMTVPMRYSQVVAPESGYMQVINYTPSRNNYNLPPSHRLNVGVNLRKPTGRGGESVWNLSVYNAYNSMNPNLIFHNSLSYENPDEVSRIDKDVVFLTKVTFLPILPAFSYTLTF